MTGHKWLYNSDHAKHKVEVALSNEEKVMCENQDHVITGQYIVLQADESDRVVRSVIIHLLDV